MGAILTVTHQPLAATPRGSLKNLIDSAGFQVLREVVASRSAGEAVEAANWIANEDLERSKARAVIAARYAACVEILDELQKSEDQWFTVKIEPRR